MLSGILQLLYNMADRIVIGRFAGDPNALAAVGCTGSINNLIVNFLIGVSVGCSAIIAQYYGAKKKHELSRTVHTSITADNKKPDTAPNTSRNSLLFLSGSFNNAAINPTSPKASI